MSSSTPPLQPSPPQITTNDSTTNLLQSDSFPVDNHESEPLCSSTLSVPSFTKRKFSLNISAGSLLGEPGRFNARRRLSNVSDAFSRKLSSTIGWKQTIPTADIITQGKCLCGQYIRCRLKRSGVFSRKLGLQRIRSIIGTPSIHVVREVFPALLTLGEELERMHPRVYTGILRQISRVTPEDPIKKETLTVLLSAVARDLFKTDITWGKVISLFAICGGLAVDCVVQGKAEFVPKLIDGLADVIEDELVQWINENGGWTGLSNRVRPEPQGLTVLEWFVIGFLTVIVLLLCVLVVKLFYYFVPDVLQMNGVEEK